MKTTLVKDIEHLRPGSVLEAIAGKLTKIYTDRKEGTGQYGAWSFQNAIFEDDRGDKIRLKFKNHDPIPERWQGQRIEIATKGDSKARGVEVTEYDGKKELTIHRTVEISFLDGDTRGAREDNREERRQADRERPREDRPRQERREEPREERPRDRREAERQAPPEDKLREDLARTAHLYVKCYDAAAAVAWSIHNRHEQVLPGAAVGALATSFFIEMLKRGNGTVLPPVAFDKIPLKGQPVGRLCDKLIARAEAARGGTVAPGTATTGTAQTPPQDLPGCNDEEFPF